MSKKKGIPLDQFLKPDKNITNWAEEDDDFGPEGQSNVSDPRRLSLASVATGAP